ncbi:exodeoxyribonuclease VII small subunit, partial [Bacillus atrophaeus]
MTEKKKDENITFEEAMKGLEGIVAKLEEGDVPLEQAITYFQEGMALS